MKKILFIALSAAFILASCGGVSKSQPETNDQTTEASAVAEVASDQIKLTVASEQVDCTGVGPQKCFLLKKEGDADWSFWYSGIRDFNYESGFEYVIEVRVDTVATPPADASTIVYNFVKEISKTQKQSENMPNIPSKK